MTIDECALCDQASSRVRYSPATDLYLCYRCRVENELGIEPHAIECPGCQAQPGQWCHRHGQTMPGPSLYCVARIHQARETQTQTQQPKETTK